MIVRRFRLAGVVLVLLAIAVPAWADDFSTTVEGLATDGFIAEEHAVAALATLGDTRAVAVLEALRDSRLLKAPDGRVVISETAGDKPRLVDAVTGAPVSGLDPDSLDNVLVNDRLRGDIDGALGTLMLVSPNPAERLTAARDALGHPSAETAARLTKALAVEKQSDIRAAMLEALSAARLFSGTAAQRLAAVSALGSTTDPQIRGLLDRLRGEPNLDPALRHAADAAVEAINRRLQLVGIVANIFEGVSLGSVLLLAAIGLAITFGVMGVINMAHGEMIMLGAYSAFVCQEVFRAALPPSWFDGYLVAAVPVGFLVAGGVGVVLERCVIRFLYGRPLETLLATWGISLILQQAVRSIFGAPNRAVANPGWMTGGFDAIGGFVVTWNRLYIIVFCFIVLGALALILNRTTFGLQMRAVTQNRPMASAMGIRTARIDALTFGLGSGIAGMAGVALSQIGNVSPNLGSIYIVDSFLVVVFGGVGSLFGTLVGALSLGIVNKLIEPAAGAILGKVVVLVAIILFIQRRPRGLFALKGRTAEA
ncbi:MAG TPA: urea ABC transporter permease subunit UrtB [Stellaceae bacterium]|nr:urea ABC transporter permease subunit UrtB [Stellaceae bacterium]